MRLYGVLTTLGAAGAICLIATHPAYAETSTGRSLLLAQQNKNKLTIARRTPLLATQNKKALLAKADEKQTSGVDDDKAKKTSSAPKDKSNETKSIEQPTYAIVAAGDSLASIAEKYNTTWTRIFDANESLSNPNTIDIGQKLRIPSAEEVLPDRSSAIVAAQQAAASSTPSARTSTVTTRSYSSKPINSSSYYVGNGMWCTDYVHSRRPDVAVYGNAGYGWISSAQAAGKSTGSAPRAGAVAVTNGHVAYVESVNSDGSYTVSEMGWNYRAGNYNKRTVRPGTFGQFIY
ncbi:MAG: LysM peptidoglycan-binding domain-containing protein [Candidatus Nanosynbacter sp.]|nr:LysM peptidoglycan-binding domain-containing protein [Candidatus Nanosynbacter sp.]